MFFQPKICINEQQLHLFREVGNRAKELQHGIDIKEIKEIGAALALLSKEQLLELAYARIYLLSEIAWAIYYDPRGLTPPPRETSPQPK